MRTTSSRDSWERLVAAVIKKEQIWQLCHQDSITTVDSDFGTQRELSLRSVHSSPSQLSLTKDFVNVEVRKNGSGSITQKLFSAVLWRKKPRDYDLGKGLVGIPEGHFGLESFFLHELQIATDHFSNKNFIGHGGFGKLYKGRLEDGSLVVVKRLAQVMIGEEFEISSIVAHRNVIGLRGFCNTENERLLVYPYMANRSVASFLRERRDSQPPLEWASRPRIALGVARGLDHLHHGCIRGIIHGDVKAANILLDDVFEAVVSDFTFAKFMDGIDGNGVRGTIGHIASEYLSTGKCSLETDVFSYGVFLLELITRQQAFDLAMLGDDEDTLSYWVKKVLEEKKIEIMVQQDLEANFVEDEVKKLLQIALICTQTDQERRPTMSGIVRILEDEDGLAEAWEEFSKNVNQDQNYLIAMWNYHSSHNGIDDHIAPDGIDVYGYGAFLLELVTAQRVFNLARLTNDMTLHDWVKKLLEEKKFEIMVDRDLQGNFVEKEVEKLLRIALICRQTDPKGRPTMSQVVRMLEDGDGLGEAWEEFSQSVQQDENYPSKVYPSADWITNDIVVLA